MSAHSEMSLVLYGIPRLKTKSILLDAKSRKEKLSTTTCAGMNALVAAPITLVVLTLLLLLVRFNQINNKNEAV